MTELYGTLLVIGALVLGLGLISGLIEARLPLSSPLLALFTGVLLGPTGIGVFDVGRWGDRGVILGEAARLTLAIGLMATALRLPPKYFLQHWKLQAVLIGLLMPLMWIAAAGLVYLWLGVPPLVALLIGAVVTPTDPIVASSIVTGDTATRLLPTRIRHALSAESGANDGLAIGFVGLTLLLIAPTDTSVLTSWLTTTLLREIVGGFVLGALIGAAAGWLLTLAEERGTMEKASFLAFTVALALLVLGAAGLAGVNGVLAVFVAGLAFDNMVGGSERAEEANVQEAVNQFFTLPIFALIGVALPVGDWLALGWSGAGLAASILLLRRLPATLALQRWLPDLDRRSDTLFIGWFGPIGVSALLYSSEAVHRSGEEIVWTVTSLLICASIVAHGISATPLTKRYAEAKQSKKGKGKREKGKGKNGSVLESLPKMTIPVNPNEPPRPPDTPPADPDRPEDDPRPTPPTEPDPVPVQEPPDSPGNTRGPYIVG